MARFGVLLSFQAPAHFGVSPQQVYAESIEQAVLAEELGFDSVWTTEHHFLEDGYLPSPLIASAAIASRTKRIRIAQGILLLPLYPHPVRLAEDAAVVDVISGGRLILGLGMGYRDYEYAGLGLSMRDRKSLLEEGLEILRRCWTEDRFSFEGRHWQLQDVRVRPRPVQQPHPPIWFGAASIPAMRRSAALGAAFVCAPVPPLRQIRRQLALYQDFLREAGHPADVELAVMREVYVTEDAEQAWRDVREHFLYVYRDTYGPDQVQYIDYLPDGTRRPVTDRRDPFFESERFRQDRFIFGDPEFAVGEIRRYFEETPTTLLIIRPQLPGLPHNKVARSMELFAERVMPQFKV